MTLLLFVINNDWLHPLNTESIILPAPPCICLYWDWVIFCSYQHNIQHAHCPPFFPSPGCQLTLVASTHQVLMRWTLAHYKTNKHLSSSQPAAAVSIHQVSNWPAACLFRLSTKYAVNYFTIWSFTMVSLFNYKCRYICKILSLVGEFSTQVWKYSFHCSSLACWGGRAEGTPMANIYSESATG